VSDEGIALPPIGTSASFSKTIGEADVTLFAGISGDFDPLHVDREHARALGYPERLAHGVLTLALASTCATLVEQRHGRPALSYGYDRVRFVRPVLVGDTITAGYEVVEHDPDRLRTFARVTLTNQRGEVVAAATHIALYLR
jgi:acyl dehydratase